MKHFFYVGSFVVIFPKNYMLDYYDVIFWLNLHKQHLSMEVTEKRLQFILLIQEWNQNEITEWIPQHLPTDFPPKTTTKH